MSSNVPKNSDSICREVGPAETQVHRLEQRLRLHLRQRGPDHDEDGDEEAEEEIGKEKRSQKIACFELFAVNSAQNFKQAEARQG